MDNEKNIKRFFKYVKKGEENECWLWFGARLPTGYGRFYFNGRCRYSHRVSVELFKGERVPDHLIVLHSCDTPSCVNPKHLSIGTNLDNSRDAKAKGRLVIITPDWRGLKNPKSKLSIEQRKSLIDDFSSSATTKELSAKYGITTVRVCQIRREQNK